MNGFNQNFGSKALPAIPDPSNKGIGLQPDPKAAFGTPYVPKKNSGIGLEPPPTSSIGVPYQPKSGADGPGGQSPISGPIPLPGGPVEPLPKGQPWL
ncbi:MAG: hypothetical protein KIS61_03565 [Candidatus Eremiobacteraeota bacterium]|nr:hypothetical protein [Candidatus Eremiobacteraeota bacterium]